MTDIILVYITAASMEDARTIAKALVAERLAACANLYDNMHSLYWWEGAVQEDAEVALIAKTTTDLADALIKKVKQLHPYDCPCIVTLPVTSGNPDFLNWIRSETKSEGGDLGSQTQ